MFHCEQQMVWTPDYVIYEQLVLVWPVQGNIPGNTVIDLPKVGRSKVIGK